MIRLLKYWCFACAEIVIASFLLLLISFLFSGNVNCTYWILTLPISSLIGLVLRRLFTHHKFIQIILGIPLCFAATYVSLDLLGFTGQEMIGGMVVGVIVSGFFFFRARQFWERDWSDMLVPFVAFYFIIINFIVLFIVAVAPIMAPIHPFVTAAGPFVIFVNLLSMNTLNLHNVTEIGHDSGIKNKVAVSKGIGSQNRILIVGVFFLILLVSLWSQLMDLVNTFMHWIWNGILFLLSLFSSNSSEGGAQGGSEMDMLAGLAEETQRNPFWEKVGEILTAVTATIGVIGFLIFIGYQIYRLIKKMIPAVRDYLKQYGVFDNTLDEYTDTKERLIELKDLPQKYLKNAMEWLQDRLRREPKWEELETIEDKVRFLYRRAVLKGMAKGTLFNRAKTPSETVDGLTPAITSVEVGALLKTYYNNARYGGILPTEAEVNELYRKLSV